MSSAHPPGAFHQFKHSPPDGHHAHKSAPLLPVIPDLRFESSYIRSVRAYVEVERVGAATATEENRATDAELLRHALMADGFEEVGAPTDLGGGEASVAVGSTGPSEVIRVQWKSVLWVTVRDQVISPLLQGALWALASYYITPFSSQLGSRMGTFVHQSMPTKEGLGVTWLRNWTKNLGFSNNGSQTSRTFASNSSRY